MSLGMRCGALGSTGDPQAITGVPGMRCGALGTARDP